MQVIVCQNCRAENTDDASRCVSCGESPTLAPKTVSAMGAATERGPGAARDRDPAATATGFTYPLNEGMPAPTAAPGTRIASRYELVALLGRGGMGLVYKARDLVLNEDTAIKVLQPHLVREVGDLERLKREITTARKITHANVIRIHDFGLAGDEGFISMEILPGGTLHERLQRGAIPVAEAVDIALGIAEGLGAAHAQGVIHRDIKPHNVLFDAAGVPKLADFGLARLASATSQTMGFSGTPQYMSPELADGREITPRSDVYSAGVLFYELLAGKPPFQADSLLRLATLHSKEAPPPLRTKRADVPPALESIVMRALEKDPGRRFEDGRALAAALRDFKAGGTVRLPDLPGRSRRWWLAVGAIVVLAGVAVCATILDRAGVGLGVRVETPAPTPPVAAAPSSPPPATTMPTPEPTQTPAPTAARSPLPGKTPKKTPVPTATAVAIATPSPTAPATMKVSAEPWGEIFLDEKLLHGDSNDKWKVYAVSPGKHTVRVRNPDSGLQHVCSHSFKSGERVLVKLNLASTTCKTEAFE